MAAAKKLSGRSDESLVCRENLTTDGGEPGSTCSATFTRYSPAGGLSYHSSLRRLVFNLFQAALPFHLIMFSILIHILIL